MSTLKEPWFVVERSEALAGLLLTSRADVHVRSEQRTDVGVDMLVEVDSEKTLSNRFFMVQVKGTTSSKTEDWIEGVKELYKLAENSIYLPTCVFVLNVRDNHSFYAWMAEPLIEPKGAKLRFPRPEAFHKLDRAAVDSIVDRVKAWYDVLPKQFLPG